MILLIMKMILVTQSLFANSELAKPTVKEATVTTVKDCSAFRDFQLSPPRSVCVEGEVLKFKTSKSVTKHKFRPVTKTEGIPNDSCAMSVDLGNCTYWYCDAGVLSTCR